MCVLEEMLSMDKKKILFVSNIAGKKVGSFSIASIYASEKNNLDFHLASNFNASSLDERKKDEEKYGITLHHIDFARNPLHPQNLKAYQQLVKLMKNEQFDMVHCNTPVGGLIGRIVAKKYKIKHVIYQAHGFHFYKGAPKLNWLVYYPIERLLAHWTDALITINQEDYQAAQNFKLRNNGHVYYVPGVGINLSEYENIHINRAAKRSTLGLSEKDFVLLSAGRLDYNKNNATIIKAVAKLNNPRVHFVLCGDGAERPKLSELAATLKVSDQIHFLGNRSDMKELYCTADVFVMASFREGLSRSIMEAMACGLPCIVSRIRGNVDLIQKEKGGFLVSPTSVQEFSEKINILLESDSLLKEMSTFNRAYVQNFELKKVITKMTDIYKEIIK